MATLSDTSADDFAAQLRGLAIDQIRFDYAFTLVLSDSTQVRIETSFSVDDGSVQSTYELPVGRESDILIALFGRTVSNANLTSAGVLHLGFDSGLSLQVEVDPDYESWSVVRKDGSQVIALPGGGLATFGPRSTS